MRTAALLALALAAGCKNSPSSNRLRVWSMWGGDEEEVFRSVLRAYDPTITNLPSVSDDKTIRALVAGAPPDLFTLKDPSALGALAANKALRPLDDLFAAAGLKDTDFTPGALSQCRFRGKLYAIPYLLDCMVLLYNKKLVQEPPRTLEELEELCKRLTKRDSTGRITQIGLRPPEAVQLLGAAGAQFWDENTERLTADDPRNIEGIRWYKRLMDAQGGNEAVEAFSAGFAEDMGSSNPFFKGLAAMEFSGQWNANWVFKYTPGEEIGVAPLPYPADSPKLAGTAWLGGNLFCLPREGKQTDAAFAFLKWSQTRAGQLTFASTMHGVPNQRAILQEPALRTGAPWRALFARFLDLADSPRATHFPVLPVAALYQSELTAACDAVRYGRKSPQEALKTVQAKVSRELEKYR